VFDVAVTGDGIAMLNKIQHELGIITNEGWVITLVADKPITLGDVAIQSIIVQPKEDYVKRVASDPDTPRTTYKIGTRGEVIYERV
jgi:hypothetical protein